MCYFALPVFVCFPTVFPNNFPIFPAEDDIVRACNLFFFLSPVNYSVISRLQSSISGVNGLIYLIMWRKQKADFSRKRDCLYVFMTFPGIIMENLSWDDYGLHVSPVVGLTDLNVISKTKTQRSFSA